MKIIWYKDFEKHYKKRILPHTKINLKFKERARMFVENSQNPILKDHQLTGDMKEYRSFSIAGDLRVTYKMVGQIYYFYDIGSHNQVY